jgi:hypothetical protein
MAMQQELIQENEEEINSIAVCGGNLQTVVSDQSVYINEVHYNVGSLHYIENAD